MDPVRPSPAAVDEPGVGSPIGPYDLLVPVGTGGMARVWAARMRGTGQMVALKLLLPELAENEQFQQMFFDEACIASRVTHPNVCATYELAHESGILYLAMEWVDGTSLMRVLRPDGEEEGDSPRVPLPPRLAARIVADACAGLHAAHELRGPNGRPLDVVHRDVSPHNLLIGTDGSVKVTDFGVAKALGKSHMTLAGQVKGKLAYMSPEQLLGGGVDRRSDVFALGTVLYEITTGQKPFVGEFDPQIMTAIAMGHYEPPSDVVRGYPRELEHIVMRALATEANDRYPSALEMQRALEGWLATSGPPVLSGHVGVLVRERCGAEIDGRARAVQEAMRQGAPLPLATGAGVEVDRRLAPPDRAFVWLVAAVLLGMVLGAGVLSYVRATRKAKGPVATRHAAALVAPPSGEAAAAPAPSPAPSAVEPPPRVRLKVDPPTALLLVDGVALPRGVEQLARPEDGGSLQVVVRAEGHEETLVVIDDASPDEIDVALLPLSPQRPAASRPRARAAAAGTEPAQRQNPGITAEAPPNPYE